MQERRLIMFRRLCASLFVAVLAASTVGAQDKSDVWHSFAERLNPGAFVVVTLRDGKTLQGRLVQVAPDTITVLPKTRIAVPPRELRIADIISIDSRKEGMSPGAKVLSSVGAVGAALTVIVVVMLANWRD
jgi:hypothetical protein